MKRGDVTLCLDVAVLSAPILLGAIAYGAIFTAGLGVRSVRTLIWGKR